MDDFVVLLQGRLGELKELRAALLYAGIEPQILRPPSSHPNA